MLRGNKLPVRDWLQDVEWETPRRMEGIIVELFFSKLLHASNGKKLKSITEGWFNVADKTNKGTRRWLKPWNECLTISESEKSLINTLTPSGHSFFIIEWNLKEQDTKPKIEVLAHKLDGTNLTKKLACKDTTRELQKNINEYLSKLKPKNLERQIESLTFGEWLNNTPDEILSEILVKRCLLNSFSKRMTPTDIDAIAIESECDKLTFIELKRKYPAAHRWELTNTSTDSKSILQAAEEIDRALKKINKANSNDFETICKASNLEKSKKKSFGLDTSHFEILKTCEAHSILYKYAIWNFGDRSDKGNSYQERINFLKKLLNYNLTPTNEDIDWRIYDLTTKETKGITHTTGYDSGSSSKKLRVQLLFDVPPARYSKSLSKP